MPGATVGACLATIGLGSRALSSCVAIAEEWPVIKRAYFKKVLVSHPDKGGSAAVFRDVRVSFEVLRRMFVRRDVNSFRSSQEQSTSEDYKGTRAEFEGASIPSWEYYAEAMKEEYATYRVELAKSGRSRCQARGTRKQCRSDAPFIEIGALRVGFMTESGSYGMFCHLNCWRVPSKIWLGLPDPEMCCDREEFDRALQQMNQVALNGMEDLPGSCRRQVVSYVMDKSHWTFGGDVGRVRKKPAAHAAGHEDAARAPAVSSRGSAEVATTSTELVAPPAGGRFSIPTPGRGGPAGSLSGQTFVLTGVFPEIGGGQGLQLGKARAREMIESFGGRVASAVSGKTDVLVVGRDPGFGKVSRARSNPGTRLVDLHELRLGIERGNLEGSRGRHVLVGSFSEGFARRRGGPNGLALRASREELAFASGMN